MAESGTGAQRAAEAFLPDEIVRSVSRIEGGHIHESFVVGCERTASPRYLLQRVNTAVFPRPDRMMHNIERVTDHLRRSAVRRGANPFRATLEIIRTPSGEMLFSDGDECWRLFRFIENARGHTRAASPAVAREAGNAFGRFLADLSSLPSTSLSVTIPEFFSGRRRLRELRKAVEGNPLSRRSSVLPEIEFAEAQEASAAALETALSRAEVPTRVVHHDTKLSNVLIDERRGEAVCVVDLDTVMPGTLLFDFGDLIRSAGNAACEDRFEEHRLLAWEQIRAATNGFIDGCASILSDAEAERLAAAPSQVAVLLGIRFLTDDLTGDSYFPASRPRQNLDRCRTQFALARALREQQDELAELIRDARTRFGAD